MLKILWTAFNSARRALMTIILLLSLAFNVGLVVSETLYAAVSGIAGAAMGLVSPSLRPANRVASLTTELEQERLAKRKLERELASAQADVIAESQISRKMKGEIAVSTAQLAAERVAKQKLTQEFLNQGAELTAERALLKNAKLTTARVSSKMIARMGKMAARETATAPAKAIPAYGAAIIAAGVALDFQDICQTIGDSIELQRVFDVDFVVDEKDLTVCNAKMPSKTEIYAFAISNPAIAIKKAIENMPNSIEEMNHIDFSKIDWSFIASKIKQDLEAVLNGIANGTSRTATNVTDYAALKSLQIGTWMSE